MSWASIDNQAFRADAKKTLTRMTEIMKHPAITEYSFSQTDTDTITKALKALDSMKEPNNMVDRLVNERAMEAVENGLYWSVSMLNRNGFQDAKGVAWREADKEHAEATLKEYERLMMHQRN